MLQIGTFGTMPNLKDLKISVGSRGAGELGLGGRVAGCAALRHLHLVLGPDTSLHRELPGPGLPPSLASLSLEAATMPPLHPAALKVRLAIYHSIYLSIYATTNNSHIRAGVNIQRVRGNWM